MKKAIVCFIFIIIVLVVACEKDIPDDPLPLYDFRLTELVYKNEGVNDENIKFSYSGNKLTGWYISNGISTEKVDVVYNGDNTIDFFSYVRLDSNWVAYEKMKYSFENNNLIIKEEFDFEENGWVISYRNKIDYDGDGKKIESIESYFLDGLENIYYKQAITYSGSSIIEIIKYQFFEGDWRNSIRDIYEYNGSKLSTVVTSAYISDSWMPYYKDEFKYQGDNVVEVHKLSNVGDTTWIQSYITRYSYDIDGNISNYEQSSSDEVIYSIDYLYEKESGNLSEFSFQDSYGYPDPFYRPKAQMPILRLNNVDF